MRYGILGTTQARRDDGTDVALGGARLRALLAALALTPGRPRTPDTLITDIWGLGPDGLAGPEGGYGAAADGAAAGGGLPRDAGAALQALVGRLRRALGHAAVVSVTGGYYLAADPDDVDLHRFERLAGEGERALADGDAEKAATLLDDALALWRGPALADLPDAVAEAAGAERLRLAARRSRLAADLALGRADEALPALTALCSRHPLDEQLHLLRLRALHDTGRTAEALDAYARLAADLADRLGTDPSPSLRALHADLLAAGSAEPAKSAGSTESPGRGPADAPAAGPGAVPAAATAGDAVSPERHASPERAAAPGPAPSSAAGAARARRAGNLRARLTSFVGRDAELRTLHADLTAHRLVTLLGPGGAGKTRLSQEGAEAAAAGDPDAWPDGVWFAELGPVQDPGTVPEAVLTALGARETVVRGSAAEGLRAAADPLAYDPLAQLAEHCAGRRMLLVLDNCEHVIDAAAQLAERLLAECPDVSVLATSREPLAVPGELVRPVEPLPDPVALRLLADRGAAARPGFRIEDDPEACAEICRRLDGLPLAIELAAARLRSLSPRQLADRLDDRFRLLTSGSRTVLPRQQTLRAVVDWSWDLLDAPERAVLRRLSVFSGGADLTAAESVCADTPTPTPAPAPGPAPTGPEGLTGPIAPDGSAGPDGGGARPLADPGGVAPPGATGGAAPLVAPGDVAALLGSLVDKSLVVAGPSADGEMRYRLLETVGEYAGERLDEAGERAAAERRHLVAYRELARTADPLLRGPQQRHWLDRLEQEHDNLRTALRRAVAARDEHEALCLVLSLQWFWTLRDHRGDGRTWSTAAAALGPNPFLPPVTPAPPLAERPIDAPPPMAPEQLVEARREVRLVALASVEESMRDLESPEQQEELRGVVSAYRGGLPQTCRVPGVMWFYAVLMTGRFEDVVELVDGTVRGCREFGYDWELAFILQLRARIHNDRPGGLPQATRDTDEALQIFRRLGDAWGVAEALSGRGEAREGHGEYALAAEDYRAAMRYAADLGAHGQLPLLKSRLGGALIESGDVVTGERLLHEVLEEGRQSNRDAVPFARIQLATWLTVAGRYDEARHHLERVREDFDDRAAPGLFLGMIEGSLAALDVDEGRYDGVLTAVRAAVAKMRDPLARIVAPDLPLSQMLVAARVLGLTGGPAGAAVGARLLGAFDALREPREHTPRLTRLSRTRAEDAVRAVLDGPAYDAAHAEGSSLTLDEALDLI
ncbi:BTAD domain-containing putative transcriptional regulator [Streptomyces sp. Ru73]|uniref:AfsR/SARP family transcriptional regulator n=1 Tax=Streptomyces sp. Ru73 TaxID=2080748 RepID=UPI00215608EF|nr:BTAD domain-containing putative transcriptional regulator [Streptomyces sp. Ru73]